MANQNNRNELVVQMVPTIMSLLRTTACIMMVPFCSTLCFNKILVFVKVKFSGIGSVYPAICVNHMISRVFYFYTKLICYFLFPVKYYVMEVMNLVNVIAQYFFTDYYLGSQFWKVGYHSWFLESDVNVLPTMASCRFEM